MPFTTLVTPAGLAAHLGDPQWVVFDCRFTLTDPGAGRQAYENGHIPGAYYAHLNNDLSSPVTAATGRHPLPDPDALARKLGEWGIDRTKQVVIYDDIFGAMASRMWWLLRWLGHPAVALLDGGLPRWRREGHPITVHLPAGRPARFEPEVDDRMWVDSRFVEALTEKRMGILIDARAEERFTGAVEPLDTVAGHIPGAVNWPYEDNLNLGGDFMPAADLRQAYLNLLGGRSPEQVIHMCGSGVTACHNVLAMEIAGLCGSKLYAGSWSDWITDARRPVATGSHSSQ